MIAVVTAAETVADITKAIASTMRAVVSVIRAVTNMTKADSIKKMIIMKMTVNKTELSVNVIEAMKMLMKVNQFVMMSETCDVNEVKHMI